LAGERIGRDLVSRLHTRGPVRPKYRDKKGLCSATMLLVRP
jgi:hypothetical protein